MEEFTFTAELWRWPAQDAWRFVTLPIEESEVIAMVSGPPRGFGSVPVEVVVGASRWRTSIFPDTAGGAYVLPMKKPVRKAEGLEDGDLVTVTLRVLVG